MQVLIETPNDTLSRFAAAQSAQARAVQLAEYRDLLARADWFYDFSDDYSAVVKGRAQFQRLRALQPFVDADRAMFDAARPQQHGSATL